MNNLTQIMEIKCIKNDHKWHFGTINIRSGKEKDEGAKIYTIAKELSRAG